MIMTDPSSPTSAASPSAERVRDVVAGRPIAHRGLHNPAERRIENTLSAIRAAMERGFACEVDIQLTGDGEAVVHHDERLGRLTAGSARLLDLEAAELARVDFLGGDDHIPTLQELFDCVAGRVPLIVEIKAGLDAAVDKRLTARFVEVARHYDGPLAAMSFEPAVVAELRRLAPEIIRGVVADNTRSMKHYGHLSAAARFVRRHLLHVPETQPHFVSYCVDHLPAPGPWFFRRVLGRPVITWTVRRPDQAERTRRYADQMTFEGFVP
jgi:glycerophosphoryl diester phosphodiesterase